MSSPDRAQTPTYIITLSWDVDYVRQAQRVNTKSKKRNSTNRKKIKKKKEIRKVKKEYNKSKNYSEKIAKNAEALSDIEYEKN